METIKTQMLCKFLDDARPVDEAPVRLEIREPDPRAVWGNDADPKLQGRFFKDFALEPGTRPAVEEEERNSSGVAVFGVG
jgi:hypothetical protein